VTDPAGLADWVPCRLYWQRSEPWVDWCYLGQRRFTDPFFEQTIGNCLREPFGMLFRHQTPLEMLAAMNTEQPGVQPSGFVFHMSRCGSTLVAQMLAAVNRHIVISEAGPLDFVLRARRSDGTPDRAERVSWIRGLLGVLGRRRSPAETHFFVKLDSWQILLLPILRAAFPQTPWVFVYRDPVEVMVSHREQPGIQMVPGGIDSRLFGLDPVVAPGLPIEQYMARVLEAFCSAALQHLDSGNGLLLHYSQLPGAVGTSLARHFGLSLSSGELATMAEVSTYNAKDPTFAFQPDSDRKQQAATLEMRGLAAERLGPLYQALEAARLRQGTA